MTDPITDMLNQIRNAEAVAKPEVLIPFSKLKNEIANLLAQEGFITEVKKEFPDQNWDYLDFIANRVLKANNSY